MAKAQLVRSIRGVPMEFRAAESADGTKTLDGYVAVFDSMIKVGNWFREVIRPGAFAKTLKEHDIVALSNHDTSKPLARKSEGTLELREDERGLHMHIVLDPDISWHMDQWRSIRRRDVKGASFGFEMIKEAWTESEEEGQLPLRELLEVRLFEVSPVTFPAYEATEVEARAVLAGRPTLVPHSDTHDEPETGAGATQPTEPGTEPHSRACVSVLRLQLELERELNNEENR